MLQDDSRKELYGDLLPVEGRQRRLGWVQARTIYLDKAIHDVRALPQPSSMCMCGPMLPCGLLAEHGCDSPSLAIYPHQQCHHTELPHQLAKWQPCAGWPGPRLGCHALGCPRMAAMPALLLGYMIGYTTGCPPHGILHWSCAGYPLIWHAASTWARTLALLGRHQTRPLCSRMCHWELREAHLPCVPCKAWRHAGSVLVRWCLAEHAACARGR